MGMKDPSHVWRLGIQALTCAALLACNTSRELAPGATGGPSTSVAPLATVPVASARRIELPPEPPPPVADLASEVPELERKLSENKAYRGMWDPERSDVRDLLLSALSQLLSVGGYVGQVLTAIDHKKDIDDAATKLFLIHSRIGRYPDDFTAKLKAHLASVRTEPNLGVWRPLVKGQVPMDFSALALWMNREQAPYVRAMLAARKDGPAPWVSAEKADRPYLADEMAAIEWLAKLGPLEPTEKQRLDELHLDASAVRVAIKDLLAEYKDNEVRADGRFKGKLVRVGGIVGDVKKDAFDSIYVTIGTGKVFEVPVLHCFAAKGQEQRAAALSRGGKVMVRGRVEGLFVGNVVAKRCEIVE